MALITIKMKKNRNVFNKFVLLQLWRNSGEKKIVLQTESEKNLLDLRDHAINLNIPYYLANDNDANANVKTVLSLGPYPSIFIDQVTGGLKLYS